MPVQFLRITHDVNFFDHGRIVLGGTPRRLVRLNAPAARLMHKLLLAGSAGVALDTDLERSVGRTLIDRGLAQPVVFGHGKSEQDWEAEVVIPTRDRADKVDRLLTSMARPDVLVIDDASYNAEALIDVVTRAHGRLVRHDINTGPAGARNTGLRHTTAPFIAFIDSDCIASPTWPQELLEHFDDPNVALVASRIVNRGQGHGLLDAYETRHGALDGGFDPTTVEPGALLESVPSAAIVIRRSALDGQGFDENLRIGEDLDLIWRLVQSGWVIRYEPNSVVHHESLTHFSGWLRRRFEYGTFAGPFEERYPGKRSPVFEWWALTAAFFVVFGHPALAASVGVTRLIQRWWPLRALPDSERFALTITRQEFASQWRYLALSLRSEWWPAGALILLSSRNSQTGRRASAFILAPVAWDLVSRRQHASTVSDALLSILDDAATATGAAVSLVRSKKTLALLPRVRLPWKKRAKRSIRQYGNRE